MSKLLIELDWEVGQSALTPKARTVPRRPSSYCGRPGRHYMQPRTSVWRIEVGYHLFESVFDCPI